MSTGMLISIPAQPHVYIQLLLQLHIHQEHPDKPLLEHTQELIANLEGMGIKPSPPGEGEDEADDGEWVDDDADSEDGDEDVEMS